MVVCVQQECLRGARLVGWREYVWERAADGETGAVGPTAGRERDRQRRGVRTCLATGSAALAKGARECSGLVACCERVGSIERDN